MDDLLCAFPTESAEPRDIRDAARARFGRDPTDQAVLRHVFRPVHTVVGTCGFLGPSRREAPAHAAETPMGRSGDGPPVGAEAVRPVLASLDRLQRISNALETAGREPSGADADPIGALEPTAAAQIDTSGAEAVAAFWSASAEGPTTVPASEAAAYLAATLDAIRVSA